MSFNQWAIDETSVLGSIIGWIEFFMTLIPAGIVRLFGLRVYESYDLI